MAISKIYLTVPYAQKDTAKALGARWDAAHKKWYVPADKDPALFTHWQPSGDSQTLLLTTVATPKSRSSSAKTVQGVVICAIAKNFIAYNGDEPPWD